MTLALTKTLDPADFEQLRSELVIVDDVFTLEAEQHPMRRWEYALALRAHDTWAQAARIGGPVYDVGGHGSPFYRMLDPYQVQVIDPRELHGADLAGFLAGSPRLGAAVFCLSVLEHVDDLDAFLYHLSCLVAPGGLLFLTVDYAPGVETPGAVSDRYHFHWMRKRIFSRWLLEAWTLNPLERAGFSLFGGIDLSPLRTPAVYDYTFASLALQKRA